MRRRKPGGAEVASAVMAGKGADGNRRVGRPEGGGADRADIAPGGGGENGGAVGVASLALVGRHAERRVALEMLGDAEALARGELDVGDRHVILEIDEGLALALFDLPHRAGRDGWRGNGGTRRRSGEAAFGRGLGAGFVPFGKTGLEPVRAPGRAGDTHPWRQSPRDKRRETLVPLRLAVEMGGEMKRRVPAAGHGDEVASETLAGAARVPDLNTFDAVAPAHALDRGVSEVSGPRRLGCLLRGA